MAITYHEYVDFVEKVAAINTTNYTTTEFFDTLKALVEEAKRIKADSADGAFNQEWQSSRRGANMASQAEKLSSDQRQSLFTAAMLLLQGEKVIRVPHDGTWLFNMNMVATGNDCARVSKAENGCGTVGCIHGLVNMIEVSAGRWDTWNSTLDGHYNERTRKSEPLHRPRYADYGHPCRLLFYPNNASWNRTLGDITPKMAGIAILQFLGGNDEPNYRKIEDMLEVADRETNQA